MKVEAVACDASGCDHIAVPEEGADLPYDWLTLVVYQEGNGTIEEKTLCSWECLHRLIKYHERSTVPVRKRRAVSGSNGPVPEPSSDSSEPALAPT